MAEQETTYYVVTDEQLRQLADDAATTAAGDVAAGVGSAVTGAHDSLSGQISTLSAGMDGMAAASGTVALTDQQFGQLQDLMSSQLHGLLYLFGALMFLVGFYGITQVVKHWRAG